jgi:hypothetical protein
MTLSLHADVASGNTATLASVPQPTKSDTNLTNASASRRAHSVDTWAAPGERSNPPALWTERFHQPGLKDGAQLVAGLRQPNLRRYASTRLNNSTTCRF